jgi:parallel beta-helix repeat protein
MNVSALLNSTPVSMNTQLPNNNISISNISATYSITEGETLYIDANYADADGDTGTFADNATQWNVNTSTGIVSWVTTDGDQGIYPWQINVSDGYGSISVYNFTVTVDESLCSALLQDNIIYVYGNYSTNLTCIKNEINNASALEYLGSNEFLLKVPMIVNDTATVLNINNSDTAWLKLQSLNNSNVSYLKAQGTVEISNTKLTSWNNTSGTVAPNSDSIRSYIWINGTSSNANILNSNLSYLGYSEYYDSHSGISFQDTQGNVSNNIITGNYNGLTILSPVWTTTVHNNTISNVTWGLFALNYNSGLINFSENNISNYSTGIQVNNIPNITLYHNTLQYGTGSGIYLYNSVGYVDYNTIRNSSNSIVLNPANNSYIRNNTILNSSGEGIAILAASEYNLIEYNSINHTNLEGFDIENCSNNIFRYNNVTGAYYDGYFIWNANNTTIEHSRMFENGWGYGHGLQAWNSSKIYIQNNEVYDNLKVGMMFTDNGSEYYINNNTIYGNQLGYGIVMYNTSGHIFTNNSISEVYDYMLGGYYASKNNYDWTNNITVRDPFDSWSTVKFYANNTSIKFEDTDNTLFNETASETAYWYPIIANLTLNGSINNDVNITRLNASVLPSSDSLGITVYNWSLSASDNYYKKWNESTSNVSVTSNHVVGDFAPNANIQIKINSTSWNSYVSNASGYITFTYNGGYSEIQFEAQQIEGNISSINVSVYAGSWQPILVNNSMTMAQYGAQIGALAISSWNTTTQSWNTHIIGRQSKASWPVIKGQGVDARFITNKTINLTLNTSYTWNLSSGWNLVGIESITPT